MDQTLLLNYIYEISVYCTSIVGRAADGTIIHGRNLDFEPTEAMRENTYIAQFVKNGEVVFESVHFSGIIGVYTGIREGGFSVS